MMVSAKENASILSVIWMEETAALSQHHASSSATRFQETTFATKVAIVRHVIGMEETACVVQAAYRLYWMACQAAAI
jgi:hypothetical protein